LNNIAVYRDFGRDSADKSNLNIPALFLRQIFCMANLGISNCNPQKCVRFTMLGN